MNGISSIQGIAQTGPNAKRVAQFLAAAPPLVLVIAALSIVWQYNPATRPLTEDPGIFAYISQLVAQGFAPHKYAFNEQASLTYLFGGASMWLGDWFGLHHLISFRIASLFVFCATAVLLWLLTLQFTRSRWIAFLAGAIWIGLEGSGVRAATALEPKAFMLLFGLGTLLLLKRRQWFWAGVLGCAAGLAWQIAWGYLIVAFVLAFVQGGKTWNARVRAVAITIGAALTTFAIYTLYFVAHDAAREMLQQTFIAPILMHSVAARPLLRRVMQLGNTFALGYSSHIVFGVLGGLGVVAWLVAQMRPWEIRELWRRGVYFFLQNRRTAGTLLTVSGFGLYCFVDFQGYPDWFPLLPFVAMFAAWLLWQLCARVLRVLQVSPSTARFVYGALAVLVLIASAAHAFLVPAPTRHLTTETWQVQQQLAEELQNTIGEKTSVWVLGKAELLFFMRRENLNKYIYLFGDVDAAADVFEPGGFQKMYADALAQKPGLLVVARLKKRKFASSAHFHQVEKSYQQFLFLHHCKGMGIGRFMVQPALADTLFPKNAQGCVKR